MTDHSGDLQEMVGIRSMWMERYLGSLVAVELAW